MNERIDKQGFSIIICSYNGASRLEPTLRHLSNLKIPKECSVELVMVNNASTDNTVAFTEFCWNELGSPFKLRIINEKRPGKGYAIETGYDVARYKYILTADDDNWLDENYLVNALKLFNKDTDIGILQGKLDGVFETSPPEWIAKFKKYFIIGSPIAETGYFPPKNCWVWGAGMIIKKADWDYLRSLGLSFLTSKISGKAAGEDNETAIALLVMGRKIYYSDTLMLKHFMPVGRITWGKLKQNFEFFGYVSYFLFLYKIVIDAYNSGHTVQPNEVKKKFPKYWLRRMKAYGYFQNIIYFCKPDKSLRYLNWVQSYTMGKNYVSLNKHADHDVQTISKWLLPLLKSNTGYFEYSF